MSSNHYKVTKDNEKVVLVKLTVQEIHNYHQLNEREQKRYVDSLLFSTDLSRTFAWKLDNELSSYSQDGDADWYTLKVEDDKSISYDQKKELIDTLFNSFDEKQQWEVLSMLGEYLNVKNFE